MAKSLVIVESPAKAKTIEKYLGKDFTVTSTMGHIRDLPKSELGVDVEHEFAPKYVDMKGKEKVIKSLKSKIPAGGTVYLALDPDREGEAIAWHTAMALGLVSPSGRNSTKSKADVKRVTFHEISEDAVNEAISKPKSLNMDLVNAQQARRVLDRLVGYTLSPLVWRKIRYGLSAGRVQSVAVRLIVERERERDAFKPEEYWGVDAILADDKKNQFLFSLVKKEGKKYAPKNSDEADSVKDFVEGKEWKVSKVTKKEKKGYPKPPFITSTLQQVANNKLGFSAKKTMMLAQKLYQGVKLADRGQVSLITYMRTDSFALSDKAIKSTRAVIESDFGKDYLPSKPNLYKRKSKNAQEAHEAIRPVDIKLVPDVVKGSLERDLYRLYKLIWNRTVACQMVPAVYDSMSADIMMGDYLFRSSSQVVKFPGYLKAWGISKTSKKDSAVADEAFVNVGLAENQVLSFVKMNLEQHFTKPPARYTDASLVKELEKHDIGRPSTYAPIITTIQSRGYVSKEGRYFYPEDTGYVVNDLLVKHFKDIVDYDFTADMENGLDRVADGTEDWVKMMDKFYFPFKDLVDKKDKSINKEDVVILGDSEEKCPECKSKMVVKLGKYGRFLSCTKFPECKGMKSIGGEDQVEELDEKKYKRVKACPECKSEMKLKIGKYGRFWACVNYPKCKGASPLLLKEKCPECKHNLVERKGRWGKSFIGCSNYPKCKYIKKNKKKPAKKSKK